MATIAVFLALGGGAYAATQLPSNSVGARQIRNGSVTPAKLSSATKSLLRQATGPAGPPGLTGAQGLRGESGTAGNPGATGPSDTYTAGGSAITLLAGESHTVAVLEPSIGEYIVTGEVNVTSHGGQLFCQIELSGVSEAFPSFVEVPANEIAMLVVSAPVLTSSNDRAIELRCNAETAPMTVKGTPRLTAVRAGALHLN